MKSHAAYKHITIWEPYFIVSYITYTSISLTSLICSENKHSSSKMAHSVVELKELP